MNRLGIVIFAAIMGVSSNVHARPVEGAVTTERGGDKEHHGNRERERADRPERERPERSERQFDREHFERPERADKLSRVNKDVSTLSGENVETESGDSMSQEDRERAENEADYPEMFNEHFIPDENGDPVLRSEYDREFSEELQEREAMEDGELPEDVATELPEK